MNVKWIRGLAIHHFDEMLLHLATKCNLKDDAQGPLAKAILRGRLWRIALRVKKLSTTTEADEVKPEPAQ